MKKLLDNSSLNSSQLDTAFNFLGSRSLDTSFLSTIDKSCCIIFKMQLLGVTLNMSCSKNLQENVHGNFSKATCKFQIPTFYPTVKKMFTILAISFLSDNVNVFTSYKP